MTAKEAKIKLMYWYLRSGRFIATLTEMQLFSMFIADMVVVDEDFITMEVEIKTSLSDLWTELNCIKKWKKELELNYPTAKFAKHNTYLDQILKTEGNTNRYFIPNKFYFAVAGEDLLKDARKELEGTPYGLVFLREATGAVFDPEVIIQGKRLHDNPLDKEFLRGILKRMSWENYNLRSR